MFGVDADGHRTVVQQFHFHVGAELARTDFLAQTDAQFLAEVFVHRDGDVGFGRADVRGAVTLLGRGMQGELAYDQQAAVHFADGLVHDAVFIVENTEGDNLFAEPVGILLRVGFFDADQN